MQEISSTKYWYKVLFSFKKGYYIDDVEIISMKYIFLGSTKLSLSILEFLIKNSYIPSAIFYIPQNFKVRYSGKEVEMHNYNYADLYSFAEKNKIPSFEVESGKGKRIEIYKHIIESMDLDLVLVIGWYYLIPKSLLNIPRYGFWGLHASLLPKYAGGSPLVWAIINGEKETGVTLFKMNEKVDAGDIIMQRKIRICYNDTIKTLLKKVEKISREIILEAFENIENIKFMPQNGIPIKYPQRKPEDGRIDWNKTSFEIYNFVRAQTRPYPGAFTLLNNQIVKIWEVVPFDINFAIFEPGYVVKKFINGELLVKTGDSFLIVKDYSANFIINEGDIFESANFRQQMKQIIKRHYQKYPEFKINEKIEDLAK